MTDQTSRSAIPHTDHPLRHWDRTCPACIADEANADAHGDGVYKAISEYVADYEFRGDDGDHTPVEAERILIEDAIMGLLVDEAFLSAFKALHPVPLMLEPCPQQSRRSSRPRKRNT